MIKELIFSGKKYFEGNVPNYIAKNIKPPKNNLNYFFLSSSPSEGTNMVQAVASLTPADLNNKEILAQFLNGINDYYLLIQPAGYDSYINCWIKLTDLVQNGGVSSSPLTHLHQGLRHLLDREVAYVFD